MSTYITYYKHRDHDRPLPPDSKEKLAEHLLVLLQIQVSKMKSEVGNDPLVCGE